MDIVAAGGGGLTPPFERALAVDAMRPGVIACPADASIEVVARIMATNGVHAVLVTGILEGQPWGVVTDRDVLGVAADAAHRTAGTCARGGLVTVTPGERLAKAVELMLEHDASHLLVLDREHELPLGVISTLDVARVVAGAGSVDPGARPSSRSR